MKFLTALKDRMDGWMNAITGLGGVRDKTVGNAICDTDILTEHQLENLYTNDLAQKIVDSVPDMAFMKGYAVADDEEGDLKECLEDKWDLQRVVRDSYSFGRLFGASAIILGVDRGRMDEPVDLETVGQGQLSYLWPVTKREMSELEYDPITGEPTVYLITPVNAAASSELQGARVHVSRMVMFEGARTTPYMKRRNGGYSLSVLQRVYETLRDTNTNWRSAIALMSDANQAVFKIKGLIDMISDNDPTIMQNRMELVNYSRSVAKAIVLDAEDESFDQVGVPNLQNVDKILMVTWQRLAAAADMPVTVLMGMSPAGLNATGESDLELWHARVAYAQENVLRRNMRTLARAIALHEGIPLGEGFDILFPPIEEQSGTEKAQERKIVAETDAIYIREGVVLAEEVTKARWGNGEYSPDLAHVIDTEIRESKLARELELALEESSEDDQPENGEGVPNGTGEGVDGGEPPDSQGAEGPPGRNEDSE